MDKTQQNSEKAKECVCEHSKMDVSTQHAIPETSKYLVSEAAGLVELKECKVPTPGVGEVLVRTLACGLCHTDVHCVSRDWESPPTVKVFGHEGIGEIVAIGDEVRTHLKIGMRVGISWLGYACGNCDQCCSGKENFCLHQLNHGFNIDGCLGGYTVVNANFCHQIPSQLTSAQAAPLLCAGVTSYTALKNSGARAGDFVMITGAAGGLGHLCVQYACAMGMRVIAVDIGLEKLSFCQSLGAEASLDPTDPLFMDTVMSKTLGGCQAVICLAPNLKSIEQSIHALRKCGTAVLVALPKGKLSLSIFEIVTKGITLIGSLVGTRQDMRETLDFAARGLVVCKTHIAPMKDFESVLHNLKLNTYEGRVVFQDIPDSIN